MKMSVAEWKQRMTENPLNHGESAFALCLIIEQGAVCGPCKDDNHIFCTGEAKDIIARKPIECQCIICPVFSDVLIDPIRLVEVLDVIFMELPDGQRHLADLTTPIYRKLIEELAS